MSSAGSNHPLTVRLNSIGSFSDQVEDNIGLYLNFLYEGGLYDKLASGRPGEDIVLNLADAYAEIADMIFWGKDDHYDEALRAFPLFVQYIIQANLELDDLYNVYRIVSSFFDGEPEGSGPEHLVELRGAVHRLSGIFGEETCRSAIKVAMQDKSRPDFDELISIATWFYGEDEFELCFDYARHQPVQALSISPHWLIDMEDAQRGRFIAWARSCMPPHRLSQPLARTHNYSEAEKAVLARVLAASDHTLTDLQDRQDFIVWGLSSTDKHLASAAARLLEDMPSTQWPEGSIGIIMDLFEAMEPSWSSKERLSKLLRKV